MKDEKNVNTNKEKALESAIKQIERDFGKGSIMILGEDQTVKNVEVIPSGSLALDIALGVGGYPRGRVIEIYGPESSGKTTLTLHALAEAQKMGGVVAFVDAEHALDIVYAKNLGVDVNHMLISQPDSGEQALEIVDTLVRSNAVDMVVIDSVAALVPRAEIEGAMGDAQMGLQARLMSQALRKLTASVSKSKTTVIFTNQIRMKIGVMFGNPETTTGGNALKFYATIRLDIRRRTPIKEGDKIIGNETQVKVVKNKVAPPFREAKFDIIYGKGIVRENELIEIGINDEIVSKRGSWLSYIQEDGEEISLGQGKNKAVQYLHENPELAAEIERRIRKAHGLLKDESEEVKEEKEENGSKSKES